MQLHLVADRLTEEYYNSEWLLIKDKYFEFDVPNSL